MYWKLFEGLFEAHAKRKAIQQCHDTKMAMLAGAWGNSNYDAQEEGKEGVRTKFLEEIESGYKRAVVEIRTGMKDKDREIDWTDPFFAAIKAPRISTEDSIVSGMEEEAAARYAKTHNLLVEARKESDQG